jgi:hypothetical protein
VGIVLVLATRARLVSHGQFWSQGETFEIVALGYTSSIVKDLARHSIKQNRRSVGCENAIYLG